jgi:tetratricopeptide (TPR) repeat protein
MTTQRLLTWLLTLLVLLFGVSGALGVMPAYDRSLSSGALIAVLVSVVVYLLAGSLPRTWPGVRTASGVILVAATLAALYFITQFGHHNYPEIQGFVRRLGRITTLPIQLGDLSLHPNAVATFLETAVPLGIALAVSSRDVRPKRFWIGCLAIIFYALFLTLSYRGWIALLATALVVAVLYAVLNMPRAFALLTIGFVLLGTALAVLLVVKRGMGQMPPGLAQDLYGLGRQFQNTFYLATDYPFTGIGLGDTYGMVYSRYSLLIFVPFLTYSNNLFLSVWLNQGLLGLAAFLGIAATFYGLVVHVLRTTTKLRRVFHGAWLGVTVTLIHGLLDARQYADSYWVMPMFFAVLGLTVAAARIAVTDTEDYSLRNRVAWRRWLALGAAGVGIAAGAFVIFNRPIMAAWYTNLGAVDETRGELADNLTDDQRDAYFDSAEVYYRQALELDPNYPNANRRLGNLFVKRDQFEEAVPLLETAFAGESANQAAIKGLGLAYVWVGRTDDAARILSLHREANAIISELDTWGFFRKDTQGRPLLAARAWETAQLMSPDSTDVNVWLLIADTYRSADDMDSARRWYNRVLEVEPDNQLAHEALAQMG